MLSTPKCKKCRREGKKLFLKGERCNTGKCAIVKRNYPPGAQGNKKGPGKMTEYGMQLREKQQAKRIYGLSETQFKNYFKQAIRKKGDTGSKLLELLEMRLDNAVYRLGLGRSRKEARQLVRHGFFELDGKKADIPSIEVKVNNKLKLKNSKAGKKILQDLDKKIDPSKIPSWLSFEVKAMEGKVVSKPNAEEVNPQFDIKSIVEFYSRL
ncbi:MAG: 30S ribosomal protein S4 [bacterium]